MADLFINNIYLEAAQEALNKGAAVFNPVRRYPHFETITDLNILLEKLYEQIANESNLLSSVAKHSMANLFNAQSELSEKDSLLASSSSG